MPSNERISCAKQYPERNEHQDGKMKKKKSPHVHSFTCFACSSAQHSFIFAKLLMSSWRMEWLKLRSLLLLLVLLRPECNKQYITVPQQTNDVKLIAAPTLLSGSTPRGGASFRQASPKTTKRQQSYGRELVWQPNSQSFSRISEICATPFFWGDK